MIVAAGAVHRETLKRLERSAHHVVHVIEAIVGILEVPVQNAGAQTDEAGRGQAIEGRVIQFVACELLFNKLVIRFVFIECLDHVIAVTPGVFEIVIVFITGAIGKAGHIQPHARPAFSVVRRIEKLVDQVLISPGRLVIDESVNLGRCRQDSDQIKICPANESIAVRHGRRRQSFFFLFCSDECIDGILIPARVVDPRRLLRNRLLESPPLAVCVRDLPLPIIPIHQQRGVIGLVLIGCAGLATRHGSAGIDPISDRGNFFVSQRRNGGQRHRRLHLTGDAFINQAFLRIAWHKGHPMIAALEHSFTSAQIEL